MRDLGVHVFASVLLPLLIFRPNTFFSTNLSHYCSLETSSWTTSTLGFFFHPPTLQSPPSISPEPLIPVHAWRKMAAVLSACRAISILGH